MNKEVFQELGAFLLIGMAVCAVLIFTSCGSAPSVSAPAPSPAYTVPVDSEAARTGGTVTSGLRSGDFGVTQNSIDSLLNNKSRSQRPGLGTGWGKRINSSLGNTHFVRENDRPFGGVATIYYNDKLSLIHISEPTRPY